MKIPIKIKVGGIIYQIKMVDYLPTEEAGSKWGECDYQRGIIRIWKGLSREKQEQTFVHELTHAIAHEAGIDNQDEDIINRFALVAYMVIKDFNQPEKISTREYVVNQQKITEIPISKSSDQH